MKSGAVALFLASRLEGWWLFLVVRDPGNHEFPDHEKNDLDLDFLLLILSLIHISEPTRP